MSHVTQVEHLWSAHGCLVQGWGWAGCDRDSRLVIVLIVSASGSLSQISIVRCDRLYGVSSDLTSGALVLTLTAVYDFACGLPCVNSVEVGGFAVLM